MNEPLTPPDPKPNSDQVICENCENIIDIGMVRLTNEGDYGCTECIIKCAYCGDFYFGQDMYSCPYYGKICNDCVKDNEYKEDVKNKVLQESLRCYFDSTSNARIEQNIIDVAWQKGYFDLAYELQNDK